MNYRLPKNESVDTWLARYQFKAKVESHGFGTIDERHVPGGIIDFVVGLATRDKRIYFNTMAGVELKVDYYDLINTHNTGKNFFSFHFNYLLIPYDIAYQSVKYMKSKMEYDHVGILVYDENMAITVERYAKFYVPTDKFYRNLETWENDSLNMPDTTAVEVYDSVKSLLCYAADSELSVCEIYNIRNHTSRQVRIYKNAIVRVKEKIA